MAELVPTGEFGNQGDIMPIDCVSDKETRQRHIDSASSRGLPLCQFGSAKKGKLAIVASAPSVAGYVPMLREWDGDIWGINGAFGWMIHRGIKPTGFVGVDPEEMLKDYLPEPPDVTYYLASQVHPGVFDHLKDRNVNLWHMSDKEVERWPEGAILVQGGSSCLTRAPWLAYMLGWEDVHIFGGDSSFTHKTHVYGGQIPSNFCFAEVRGQLFRTHKVMMVQACDVVDLVSNFPGMITIHGHGLMQSMVEEYKNSGVHEWLAKQEALEMGMNRKQRRALKKCRA